MAAEFTTPIKPTEGESSEPFMALPGPLVMVAMNKFTVRPGKKDPAHVLHSLGVGRHSLCATDKKRIIVFGHPDQQYVVTDRRKVLHEADRAEVYDDAFDAGRVLPVDGVEDPENAPPEGDYPKIGKLVGEVKRMRFLAKVWPEALRDIAAVALAANTGEVELYLGGTDEHPQIGFRFVHYNSQPSFGDAYEVPVVGLTIARGKDEKRSRDDDGGDE